MTRPRQSIQTVHVPVVTTIYFFVLLLVFSHFPFSVAELEAQEQARSTTGSVLPRLGTTTSTRHPNAVVGVGVIVPPILGPKGVPTFPRNLRTLEEYYHTNNKNDDDNDDNGVYHHYKKAALQTTGSMWSLPPNQWSPLQWFFFSVMLFTFGSCFFCWCLACIIPRCCGQKGTLMYSAMMV
jgi:hypothetical protein